MTLGGRWLGAVLGWFVVLSVAPRFATEAQAATPIIVDHHARRLSAIPPAWILQAKASLHIAYGHTSHGSQLVTGMQGLYNWKGSLYAFNEGGTGGALDLDDYAFSGASDLGNPNWTAWATATRTYLASHPATNVVIWSWCGQVTSATEADINTYLGLMSSLERDFPGVRFVYMTGHLDGTGATGNLHLRNEQIRDYCRANNKILYDFADIESYDPDGVVNYMAKLANDNNDYDGDGNGSRERNWAGDWQAAHVQNVDWYMCSPAHTQPLNGNLKAYAAWWLWARLAGWSGSPADGDLNLDSRGDLIARDTAGVVQGLVSTGMALAATPWSAGFVPHRYDVYVADVDGDGRADLVARNKNDGGVEVFRSTGTVFAYASGSGPGGVWSYGWGTSYDLRFADVTGDGKADLVGRRLSTGDVHVFPSTGSGFAYAAGSGPGGLWSYGWSSGYDLYLADVTGDGKADLVSRYFGPTRELTGDVYVGVSTGNGFVSPKRWSYGYSAGYNLYFGDVDGDGRADMVSRYYGPTTGLTGDIHVMCSTGTGFAWSLGSGRMSYGWGSSYELVVRDMTGDGRADLVSRRIDTGEVEVAPWTGSGFAYDGVWAAGLGSSWELH